MLKIFHNKFQVRGRRYIHSNFYQFHRFRYAKQEFVEHLLQKEQIPVELAIHKLHKNWSFAEKKGYSGVATFSKIKPKKVKTGIGKKKFDSELDSEELIVIKEDDSNRIRAQLIKKEGEQILYCESNMRREKEMSMKSRFEKRFEAALESIKSSLSKTRGKKNYNAIMERIGRAREKNKLVSLFLSRPGLFITHPMGHLNYPL